MRRMVIVLTSVMVLAGLILALANTAFSPQIRKNQEKALETSLAAIFPGAASPTFTKLATQDLAIYKGVDANKKLLGYAVAVVTNGYGGPINLLVGLAPNLATISGMEVVSDVETPGMGSKIADDWFRNQFKGLNPTSTITYVKNQTPDPKKNQIEAISGATISTRAVLAGLNSTLANAVKEIKSLGTQ